jgi:peptide/nickel transport system substrate-binding protein
MKKSFYVLLMTSLVLLVWLLVSISYGATDKAESVKVKTANIKEPQYGGTISFARSIAPISWDNYDWQWKHGQDTGFYNEHLMMGDLQKGPRGTNQFPFKGSHYMPPKILRGELLERWETKKNPMQIILHLRKGIMWQEKPEIMKAREFVADDVVYNITRLKNSKKAFPGRLDFVGKMETPDKYTVIINMTKWCSEWPLYLGYGYYEGIQAPEQEKAPGGPGKWENACGTGPFMITEYKDGHSQTYTKNPNYWDSEAINRKKYKLPFVDKVYIPIIKDEQTTLSLFRTGKLDIMNFISWKNVADLKKSNPQLLWARVIDSTNFSLCLRMDKKPLNDIRVRRALNLAINKKEIIDNFYGGNAEMHTYPFPPSFTDVYTPLDKLTPAAKEMYTYNPEKAKKLLAEAGYPDGFTFKAQIANYNQTYLDLAQLVVGYLDKIGVKLVLEPMDYNSLLSTMLKKNHQYAIFTSSGPSAPYQGIQKSFMAGQLWNAHMMSDPYLDKDWTNGVENPNLTEKQSLEITKKLAVYVLEQAPAIILPTLYSYTAWWPWVKNYFGEDYIGCFRDAPIFARIWIDQDMKKKMGY